MTMGIVLVASFAARIPRIVPETITLTFSDLGAEVNRPALKKRLSDGFSIVISEFRIIDVLFRRDFD